MASYNKEGDKVASKPSSPAPKLSDPSVINSIKLMYQVKLDLICHHVMLLLILLSNDYDTCNLKNVYVNL